MTCPKCNGKVSVTDSVHAFANTEYRRKKCTECGHIFYTAEVEVENDDKFKRAWARYHRRNGVKAK